MGISHFNFRRCPSGPLCGLKPLDPPPMAQSRASRSPPPNWALTASRHGQNVESRSSVILPDGSTGEEKNPPSNTDTFRKGFHAGARPGRSKFLIRRGRPHRFRIRNRIIPKPHGRRFLLPRRFRPQRPHNPLRPGFSRPHNPLRFGDPRPHNPLQIERQESPPPRHLKNQEPFRFWVPFQLRNPCD